MANVKSPELRLSIRSGTMIREPVNGSIVRAIHNDNWPTRRRFNMEFRQINRTDKDALLTVILASRPGNSIDITDVYGNDYSIVVMSDVDIVQDRFYQGDCIDPSLYTVTFEAEGEKA